MDSIFILLLYSTVIFVVSVLGGALPLLRTWNSKQLHLFTGLSAGVFIGATFLILLPDAVAVTDAGVVLLLVMVGFVAILMVERIVHHRHHLEFNEVEEEECEHGHVLTSTTAFIGLSVHSVMDGFALGVAIVVNQEIGFVVFLAIVAHKAIDAFSLCTTFCIAELERRRSLIYVGLFALISPIAAWISVPLLSWLQTIELGIPLALAGGTFMYVGIYDLLPEAFEEERTGYNVFATVLLGIAIMFLISSILRSSGL